MRVQCPCNLVAYCSVSCKRNDESYHRPKCQYFTAIYIQNADFSLVDEHSFKGLAGLSNLGNTCYMNSSIQCLSNTHELTQFFIQKKYKSMLNRETVNPLGTEGRLVQAWAKLISEMWRGEGQVVRPDLFKRILGQYNVTFEGYGQHDS